VILVEFVVMLALVYIAFHIILIGFKSFFSVLVLVVAAPLAVAPGPTRRFGRRSAGRLVIDGVEYFATTAGLAVVAIIQAEVTSGSVPGLTGMSSPVAKLLVMLLLAVAGAYAYHHMLVSFRRGGGGGFGGPFPKLAMFGRNVSYIDYASEVYLGRSFGAGMRGMWEERAKRHGKRGPRYSTAGSQSEDDVVDLLGKIHEELQQQRPGRNPPAPPTSNGNNNDPPPPPPGPGGQPPARPGPGQQPPGSAGHGDGVRGDGVHVYPGERAGPGRSSPSGDGGAGRAGPLPPVGPPVPPLELPPIPPVPPV
jgi:hypothetical protein